MHFPPCYFFPGLTSIVRQLGMISLCFLTACSLSAQQSPTESIRLNQVGYYPNAPKIAVLVGEFPTDAFVIKTLGKGKKVYTGKFSPVRSDEFSAKPTRIADFSGLKTAGSYVLEVPGKGTSHPFEIRPNVHESVSKAVIKGFYYLRVSTPLTEKYAGKWSRLAGHPDDRVLIHSSAASEQRPAGTVISSPGGWYDAGDYNKYIVNSGITVGTLLAAYEDFPLYYQGLSLDLPESNNQVPDLLDETLWNLRWMLTMQDPHDGGVYHKLTNAKFDPMVMPHQARETRYVVQKSTAAALDFAAVLAQASRVYQPFSRELPGLSDSCRSAAMKAWNWARSHPDVLYEQEKMNQQHAPAVSTGTYGDHSLSDEWIWAAAEMYVTTKDDAYYRAVNLFPDEQMPLPSWNQVRLLGYYTLARFENELTPAARKDLPGLKKRLIDFADELLKGVETRAYQTVMGRSEKDYIWGSSSVAANQGIALLQAYRLTGDSRYSQGALSNLDYLLGRNATGYSFVTGHGDKTPMHPHHRISEADQIVEPVPGLLSGGPNVQAPRQDKCPDYPSAYANEVFTDQVCSYASNEIAINWNAPLVYLTGAIEALQNKSGVSVGKK